MRSKVGLIFCHTHTLSLCICIYAYITQKTNRVSPFSCSFLWVGLGWVGMMMMDCSSFFEMEPTARFLFEFKAEEDLHANPRFLRHASHYMAMMDRAVDLLGPELDLLTEILIKLGTKNYVSTGSMEKIKILCVWLVFYIYIHSE